jgi:DUF1009 family protein
LRVIALEANQTLLLEREALVEAATSSNISVLAR